MTDPKELTAEQVAEIVRQELIRDREEQERLRQAQNRRRRVYDEDDGWGFF